MLRSAPSSSGSGPAGCLGGGPSPTGPGSAAGRGSGQTAGPGCGAEGGYTRTQIELQHDNIHTAAVVSLSSQEPVPVSFRKLKILRLTRVNHSITDSLNSLTDCRHSTGLFGSIRCENSSSHDSTAVNVITMSEPTRTRNCSRSVSAPRLSCPPSR